MNLLVHPTDSVVGDLPVAGDLALAQRAMILAAMADGTSTLRNLPCGPEIPCLVHILRQLGIHIESPSSRVLEIPGCEGRLQAPSETLFPSPSSEQTYLLLGLMAGQRFDSSLMVPAGVDEEILHSCLEALRRVGADIHVSGPPTMEVLRIRGRRLTSSLANLTSCSDSTRSCLLLAALTAREEIRGNEICPPGDQLENLLLMAGGEVSMQKNGFLVASDQSPSALELDLPGDVSRAAYWMTLAASRPGSRAILRHVGLNPRRIGFVDILVRMRVGVREEVHFCGQGEWHGHLDVRANELRAIHIRKGEISGLIRELPLVVLMMAQARGTSVLDGINELPTSLSAKLHQLSHNLRRLGAVIDIHPDRLVVHGNEYLEGRDVSACDDLDLTQTLLIAGLTGTAPLQIHDGVNLFKVAPDFLIELGALVGKLF